MQCKSHAMFPVFLILHLAVLGCGRPASPTTTSPEPAPAVVTVACPNGPAATLLRERGANALPRGCTLNVVTYDPPTEPPPADVWVVAAAELPRWAAAGKLHSVPASLTTSESYHWKGLLQLYRGKLLLWDSTALATPLLGEAPLCFYRSDLIEDPATLEAFRTQTNRDLKPPETWEDFARIAEFFRERRPDGFGETSLPPLPSDAEALDRLFYQTAAPYVRRSGTEPGRAEAEPSERFSFHYSLRTGRPRLAEAGFVAALQMQQRLQACRPTGTAVDPLQTFAEGRAVFCLADASAVDRLRRSAVRGKFKVCRVPGSEFVCDAATGERRPVADGNHVAYVGAAAWIAAVPKVAEQPELAWNLLAELSGPKNSRQTVMHPSSGGGAFREDHLASLDYWAGFGFDPRQTQTMVQALRQTLRPSEKESPVVRLRIPDERSHLDALGVELRKALLDGKDAQEALSAAAERWQQLDQLRGPTHLADYYRSLALEPPQPESVP